MHAHDEEYNAEAISRNAMRMLNLVRGLALGGNPEEIREEARKIVADVDGRNARFPHPPFVEAVDAILAEEGMSEEIRAGIRSRLNLWQAQPRSEILPAELRNVPVAFGLESQGHIHTIQGMLGDGKSWDEIGRAIGWHPPTAKEWYERWLITADREPLRNHAQTTEKQPDQPPESRTPPGCPRSN